MLDMPASFYQGETGNWVFLPAHSVLSQREESLGELGFPYRTNSLCDSKHLVNAVPHHLLEIGGLDGSCNSWCTRNVYNLFPGRSWRLGLLFE